MAIDPQQLADVNEQLAMLNAQLERQGQIWLEIGEAMQSGFKDKINTAEWSAEIGKGVDRASDLAETRMGQMLTKLRADWYKLGQTGDLATTRLGNGLNLLKGSMTSLGGAAKAAAGLGGIGVGAGLVGFLLFGIKREEDYLAAGERIGQIFESAGNRSQLAIQGVTGDIKSLTKEGFELSKMEARFSAVAQAAAAMGVDGAEAYGKAGFEVSGLETNLIKASSAIDMAFEQTASTAMKDALNLSRDTNTSLVDSLTLVAKLGQAGRDAGMGYQMMLGSVMQVTSSLRFMNLDQTELARVVMTTREGFQKMGVVGAKARDMTVKGLSGLAAHISGLPEAQLREIMENYAQRTGQKLSSSAFAPRAMLTQAQGDDASFAKLLMSIRDSLEQTGLRDVAQTPGEFEAALSSPLMATRLGGKWSEEMAKSFMMFTNRYIEFGGDMNKALKNVSADVREAFDREKPKETPFDRALNAAKEIIAQFAMKLFQLLQNGFMVVVEGLAGIALLLANPNELLKIGTVLGKSMEDRMDTFANLSSGMGNDLVKLWKVGGEGLKPITEGFKSPMFDLAKELYPEKGPTPSLMTLPGEYETTGQALGLKTSKAVKRILTPADMVRDLAVTTTTTVSYVPKNTETGRNL